MKVGRGLSRKSRAVLVVIIGVGATACNASVATNSSDDGRIVFVVEGAGASAVVPKEVVDVFCLDFGGGEIQVGFGKPQG